MKKDAHAKIQHVSLPLKQDKSDNEMVEQESLLKPETWAVLSHLQAKPPEMGEDILTASLTIL